MIATLLEEGIGAARKGQKAEAKVLLTLVLRENRRNEQAWLWLSEVVDTLGEQIACIEQVLKINPHNKVAGLALQKLKGQPAQSTVLPALPASTSNTPPTKANEAALVPVSPTSVSTASPLVEQSSSNRRPFRLSDGVTAIVTADHIHHQETAALPPSPAARAHEAPAQAPTQTTPVITNDVHLSSAPPFQDGLPTTEPVTQTMTRANPPATSSLSDLPLLPMILFGTLSTTAVGGMVMIAFLIFFS